jgi:Na+-transporting NADH:ubiquinone oxidoreductase subunit NqrB
MTSAPATPGHSPHGGRPCTWLTEPRYLIVGLVTLVLVLGQWRFAILGDYTRLATTLGVCVMTELVFSWFVRGQVANLQSAYVSGISLSLLTKPQAGLLWPFALGAFLAIASKYVLTYRHRHLWNPSNFAICLLLLIAPESVAVLSHQWGNDVATNAVIWFFGLIIAYRSGVLHVTLTYVMSFLVLAVARWAMIGGPLGGEIAPLTGPMYQLFVFFMITDPRTIVRTKRGQMFVVAIVAIAEALIRLAGDAGLPWLVPLYASPALFALTIVGPIALFTDLRRQRAR